MLICNVTYPLRKLFHADYIRYFIQRNPECESWAERSFAHAPSERGRKIIFALLSQRQCYITVLIQMQQIGKFPPDTVLRLSRSAKIVFLHRRISRLYAKIQFLHSFSPCKNTVFALPRKLFDPESVDKKVGIAVFSGEFSVNSYAHGSLKTSTIFFRDKTSAHISHLLASGSRELRYFTENAFCAFFRS